MLTKRNFGIVFLLWSGSISSAAFAFFTQIIAARTAGPEEYGNFAAAIVAATIVAPLAGFGIQGFWLKTFGVEGEHGLRWLAPSFRFVTVSTSLVLGAVVIWALLGPQSQRSSTCLLISTPYILGLATVELLVAKLLLEEKHTAVALWQLIPQVGRLVLVTILALGTIAAADSYTLTGAYSIVALLTFILGAHSLSKMLGGDFKLAPAYRQKDTATTSTVPTTLEVANDAWPFGFAGLFHLIYFQSSIVLLNYISGGEASGMYNVAFSVMSVVYILPAALYQKFMIPKLHRWATIDRPKFIRACRFGNTVMFLSGTGALFLTLILAPFFIPLFFGEHYRNAISILSILAICAPLRFVATSLGASLLTQENMRLKVKLMGIVAISNISGNLLLIPKWGVQGAAAVTLSSEFLLMILYYLAARYYVFKVDAK